MGKVTREQLRSTNRETGEPGTTEPEEEAALGEVFPKLVELNVSRATDGVPGCVFIQAATFRDLLRAEQELGPGVLMDAFRTIDTLQSQQVIFWFALSQGKPEMTLDESADWIPFDATERWNCLSLILEGLAMTRRTEGGDGASPKSE